MRDHGTSGGRRRPALRPLPSGLAEPQRALAEALRQVYTDRISHNQAELATALHVTKSTISRYLNGRQVVPGQTLDALADLAALTDVERARMRDLRARAVTTADSVPAPVVDSPATGVRRPRRHLGWAIAGASVVIAAGAALAVLVQVGAPSGPAGACRPTARYRVQADGNMLDASNRIVGKVYRGDEFVEDPVPVTNPYDHRYYGHVDRRQLVGFADEGKLELESRSCD